MENQETVVLFREKRKDGSVDIYYATRFPKIFVHQFVSKDGVESCAAEKMIEENKTLRFRDQEVIVLPVFGGVRSTRYIYRDNLAEAFMDAKMLHLSKNVETHELGFSHFGNKELWQRIAWKLTPPEMREVGKK